MTPPDRLEELRALLDPLVERYERSDFIATDPISIPHRYSLIQDIEISGLFAALFAWGDRKIIIRKSLELMQRMDDAPYDFIQNYQASDFKQLEGFKHRTFNDIDLKALVGLLQEIYQNHDSLEEVFLEEGRYHSVYDSLETFYQRFLSSPHFSERTLKHLASPAKGSAAKRLNMYLRWMVRYNKRGVDFGIWNKIPQSELIIPLDLHVGRAATSLGLLAKNQSNWKTALSLTEELRLLDPLDPVKYDFALFSLSLEKLL